VPSRQVAVERNGAVWSEASSPSHPASPNTPTRMMGRQGSIQPGDLGAESFGNLMRRHDSDVDTVGEDESGRPGRAQEFRDFLMFS